MKIFKANQMNVAIKLWLYCCVVTIGFTSFVSHGNTNQPKLPQLIKQIQPSIVGIALHTPIESRTPQLLGTGFVVGKGDDKLIVTNYHVIARVLREDVVQNYVTLVGKGQNPRVGKLTVLGIDPVHDLAILTTNIPLPDGLELGSNTLIDEGRDVFFMGFPIGAVLGLFPSTHQGIIAAVAPDINPARNSDELTTQMLQRLKTPFLIYQLDATAFPGNSGSPVFDRESGALVAVLNKVFVSAGKESALTNPSGISYAIPIRHLRKLANDNDIRL